MSQISPNDIRNVVVVGSKGVGKTSLVEAMLYVARATPKLGHVADRTSLLDDTPEERAHVATLEARVVSVAWNGKRVNLIDTPGEGSFQADTTLALGAADAALLVISARDGVSGGTEDVFRRVHDAGLPVLAVITRVDDENARVEDVAAEAREAFHMPVDPMEVPVGVGPKYKGVVAVRTGKAWVGRPEGPDAQPGEAPPEFRDAVARARARLVDDVAGMDDTLADHYLTDGDLSPEELEAGIRSEIARGLIVPLYFASSLDELHGIAALLDAIVELAPAPTARPPWKGRRPGDGDGATEEARKPTTDAPFAAYVFKTHVDPHAGKVQYARVLSGTLRADTSVFNASHSTRERIGQVLQGVGRDTRAVTEAVAGDIVVLPKLKATRTGDTLCDEKQGFVYAAPALPPRLFARTIVAADRGAQEKVSAALSRLTEEDPGLESGHDETGRDLVVSGLGALHLEITAERVRRRTGVEFQLGPPRIAYRETITRAIKHIEGKQKKQTGGHGQFAVCFIDVEPQARGEGFVFDDAVVGGAVPRQFIPSVEKGVVKALARGGLAGYPVVDVKVRLVDGKSHSVDSSDAAFQVAGSKAFRAAFLAAGPVLLQPIAKLTVSVPEATMGDVIGDLNSRHGKIMQTDMAGGVATVEAFVPLADTLDYEPKLKGLTAGRGTFAVAFDHYDVCPPLVAERVIRESGYKAEVDED